MAPSAMAMPSGWHPYSADEPMWMSWTGSVRASASSSFLTTETLTASSWWTVPAVQPTQLMMASGLL